MSTTLNGVDATNVLATTHAAIRHHLLHRVAVDHPKTTKVSYAFAATADHEGQDARHSKRDKLYRMYHTSKRHENDPVLRGTTRVVEPGSKNAYTVLHVGFPKPLAAHLANRGG